MAFCSAGEGWRLLCEYHWKVRLRANLQIPLPNTALCLRNPKPRSSCCVVARALDPKTEGDRNSTTSFQEDDLVYVAKLAVGSFVGAAAIKYGSALFPQITTPNLVLALIIISTPVLVAVFLLIKQSRPNP